MGQIVFTLPDEDEAKIRAKTAALGVGVSAYLRALVAEALRHNPDAHHTELLVAIRALVPTLAHALGFVHKQPDEGIENLKTYILKQYDKSR